MPPANDFVAYVDALGKLDGKGCQLEWKITSSGHDRWHAPARLQSVWHDLFLLPLDAVRADARQQPHRL